LSFGRNSDFFWSSTSLERDLALSFHVRSLELELRKFAKVWIDLKFKRDAVLALSIHGKTDR
jgi:hypothetical protein